MIESALPLLAYGIAVGIAGGAIGGTLAGLAGIGGGLIYVPLFYATMPASANSGTAMAIAVFASVVAVSCTSFFSARSHWRLKHIDLSALYRLLPGLILGAALGLWSTTHLPETSILLALAMINGWVAFDYGREHTVQSLSKERLPLFSAPIGLTSGLLGIGGGTMLVPLLRRSVNLRQAVGTASMCGFVMVLSAFVLNLLLEPDWQPLLSEQSPFLIGLWLGVLIMIPRTTLWAAKLHDRLTETAMQSLLKGLFATISILLLVDAWVS